ncbi:piggyBac transposable element-derived protein 4-like [Diorhabda sublineata]|uniref:piggyBac transposable element-derived protein 4-like n=1 Tax=Diorhabda sublineata TaxID=1163346 RepID=UPI0024E16DE0|nr:piggyBac transposable element-derived protein 4-like [Diorhabda sublineata]
MGLNKFKSLLRFIRFDNKETRSQCRDKLAAIRDIWNEINKNLKNYYLPGVNQTVDEQLVPYRARSKYMPSKPDKYGMRIWWICDSDTSYPLNGIPYYGKEGNTITHGLGKKWLSH